MTEPERVHLKLIIWLTNAHFLAYFFLGKTWKNHENLNEFMESREDLWKVIKIGENAFENQESFVVTIHGKS